MDYLDITSAVIPMSRKCWVRKYLSHNVSKLTVGVSIGKIYYILFMPVSYHMVLDLNILSALCRHKVRGHLNAGLIVFTKKNWLMNSDTELKEERTNPDNSIQRVNNGSIFSSGRGLRWCSRLQFAAEIDNVAVKMNEKSGSAPTCIWA